MEMYRRWLPLVVLIIFSQVSKTQNVEDIKSDGQGEASEKPTESDHHELLDEDLAEGNPKILSRQKRLLWITDDGRLALPPGTSLTISPTIALPLIRYPPPGFFSNITVSLPLTIDFDKLGLTDNENPLGVLPNIFARSMGRATGMLLSNYISSYMKGRKKRQTTEDKASSPFRVTMTQTDDEEALPELPEKHKYAFHGGERAILYVILEDFLTTFGMDGKACILRAICEVHSRKLHHFGLFGEVVKLFLTASKSPFAHLLDDYVTAQKIGEGTLGPGECFPYYKKCPRSLFRSSIDHKYQNNAEEEEETSDANEIHNSDFSQFNMM
ncbi:uncharacterized protein LOC129787925 [Lutzomyia longipalpis]|uniref:uncharacterized protein LOC129787925 n=1 Tax=Lutzomyia longipalpis TaxID=7200 RepID=UPI0024839884|nr:uncharacterized protein LOC129787925 [Lutzomyia longipalpis]XP_055679745.1 uncharacterized protein LOC129787925 [Lutzomyia longipalpis]